MSPAGVNCVPEKVGCETVPAGVKGVPDTGRGGRRRLEAPEGAAEPSPLVGAEVQVLAYFPERRLELVGQQLPPAVRSRSRREHRGQRHELEQRDRAERAPEVRTVPWRRPALREERADVHRVP